MVVEDRKIGSGRASGIAVLVDLVGEQQLTIVDAAFYHPKLETAGDEPCLPVYIPKAIENFRADSVGIGTIDARMFQIPFAKIRSHQSQPSLDGGKEFVYRYDRIIKLRRDGEPLPAVDRAYAQIVLSCTGGCRIEVYGRKIRL